MRRIRLLPVILVTTPLVLVARQASPNLSGRWVAIEPQKVAGHELVVTQDASTLRLEQVRLQRGETYDEFGRRHGAQKGERESTTYRLDGTVLVTTHGGQSVRSSLRGGGGRFVLRDQYFGDQHPPGFAFERVLSLDDQGRLVLEQRRPAPNDDPAQASDSVLEVRRIVFERR